MTSDDVLAIAPGIIGPAETKAAVLIYYDETQIHWCPDTGKDYQLIGHQNQILSPGTDGVEYLLGGIVYPSGEGLYQMFERKRTMEVESLLISLCEMFCDRFIFLVWDNASTHTTQLLAPFFEAHSEMIYPVYLPTYSPWLNLIERLWRQMRADITKNNFFATLGQTCQAVVDWLDDLSFEKFMTLIGLNPLTFVLH